MYEQHLASTLLKIIMAPSISQTTPYKKIYQNMANMRKEINLAMNSSVIILKSTIKIKEKDFMKLSIRR